MGRDKRIWDCAGCNKEKTADLEHHNTDIYNMYTGTLQ